MRTPRRWWPVLLAIVVVAVILAAGRTVFLRAAGRVLVAEEPLGPADAIVIAIDAGGSGVLEAADLVHDGISSRVAVLADPPDAVDREFARRGVLVDDAATRMGHQLAALGVSNVERIPRAVAGTEEEAEVLPTWCDRRGYRSIVVVTNPDHSRRLRRVLRRAMADGHAVAIVRYARYSEFDPDSWWRSRSGTRTAIVESEKLLLDFIRHPLS